VRGIICLTRPLLSYALVSSVQNNTIWGSKLHLDQTSNLELDGILANDSAPWLG